MEAKEIAKSQIRFWRAQIDGFKKKYQAGEMSKEDWLQKTREYKIRIEAVQSVFSKL
jgi:cell fate (sporulation/competence/biofilm development) regulator YlbF (YheA/YmcA/DUF963 family)